MGTQLIARSELITFRPSTEADLDFVVQNEHDAGNIGFISQWPREQHQQTLLDLTIAHWIIEANLDGRRVGHLIARGVGMPDRVIEFKRIAISSAEHGHGFGRGAVRLLKRVSFEEWNAHRLWLDVMEHNTVAQRLYLSEGFIKEGMLRESLKRGGQYVSLLLMSILEHEYFSKDPLF
ncbi:GNAT family N-acetyltransferase [Candidatus Acetothermia bacterium]|nr:GNAT family N-acetyltransferase [Candidatus Acetothermia bacterium]MBI3642842.1 GNAT family N-acetyltransferase [Candidatus Acetothermia bacterium]